jgi:anti-anti-sigma factor
MLEINEQLCDGICIVSLVGKLNAETALSFEQWSRNRDNGAVRRIVFDFSALDYLSSAGLRAVLTTNRHAERSGTALLFCGLDGIPKEVFRTAGLLKYLKVYADVSEALESEPDPKHPL